MAEIVVYRTQHCGYCVRVHALLAAKKVPFKEIDVTDDAGKRRWLVDVTRQRTVPQVFIDGRPVGGFDELARLNRSGELDRLLARADRRLADSV
jgi:glutaredoxin 3